VNADGQSRSAFDLLSYPDIAFDDVRKLWPELDSIAAPTLEQLVVDAQYAVYLDRQRKDIEAVRRDEQRSIPDDFDYQTLPGLSSELRQKLATARPQTIAQAQAVDGVTPAAITLVLAAIRRGDLRQRASA